MKAVLSILAGVAVFTDVVSAHCTIPLHHLSTIFIKINMT
jgi:hypothetical protein